MGNIRVLRGQWDRYSTAGALQLIQDDSRFTHGFRIKRFLVCANRPHLSTAGTRDWYAVLTTHENVGVDPTGSVVEWNWQDSREVAWACTDSVGDTVVEQTFELVDPTHIIIRDLYFKCSSNVTSVTDSCNYYIELEEVELSENQAVLAIIQEEAQDAGSAS